MTIAPLIGALLAFPAPPAPAVAAPAVAAPAAASPAVAAPAATGPRTFTVRYTAQLGSFAKSDGPVDVFFPIPPSNSSQEVLFTEVEAGGIPGKEETEPRFGNRFWHGRVEAPDGKPLQVSLVVTARRAQVTGPLWAAGPDSYSGEEKEKLADFLKADRLVPLSGGPIDQIDAEISSQLGARAKDPRQAARAIYDYVVDHMEYKKVGTGWGNGDTFWACSAKYGNCTDFHALFLSLARRRGIAGRFEMGFPVPADKPQGQVAGYHCWVEFYLPGRGWVPIDASEARKHPEQRELLFGTQPADRLQLSEGRDLVLPGQHDAPLNYFVYPYLEVGGKKSKVLAWRFDYADGKTSPPLVAPQVN